MGDNSTERKLLQMTLALMSVCLFLDIGLADATTNTDNESLLMPFYTGRIYPTPQQATYGTDFFPLEKTGIITGRGIAEDDMRIGFLVERIEQYGGKASLAKSLSEAFETFILVGDTAVGKDIAPDLKPPDKSEGYLIHCEKRDGKNLVVLKGTDKRGLLWAVMSLNQMITKKDGTTVLQSVEVEDYPAISERGYIGGGRNPAAAERGAPGMLSTVFYTLAFKMNKVVYSRDIMRWRNSKHAWRDPRPNYVKEDIRKTGEIYSPLGIEWYLMSRPLCDYRQPGEDKYLHIRSGNEEDFNILFKQACLVYDAGGNFGLAYDDNRVEIHPDDVRDFGSVREADMHLVSKLFKTIKGRYPDAKFMFCPPFYWGPDSPCTEYKESRTEYLKAIGERLPLNVQICWTGPRVKSFKVNKTHVEWITNLIKRKPAFYQNAVGQHVNWWHYATDAKTMWYIGFYEGFHDDIQSYMPNVSLPSDAAATATLADYLWNPDAYDAFKSIEEAVKKLTGPESWEPLVRLNKTLSYFDKLEGMEAEITPVMAKRLPDLERQLEKVEAAWKEALAVHPEAVRSWTGMQRYIDFQKNVIEKIKANPKLADSIDTSATRKHAASESDYDIASDILLTAYDLAFGTFPVLYTNGCEGRVATLALARSTEHSSLRAAFGTGEFPTDYTLSMCALDRGRNGPCRIRITVNEATIFEGKNTFSRDEWSCRTFDIPASAFEPLVTNAVITITNSENDGISRQDTSYFVLNYAVLKKRE